MKICNRYMGGGGTTYNGPYEITPGTTDIIIPKGSLLSENLTVKGDSDLVAENIKEGINLFGTIGNIISEQYEQGTVTIPRDSFPTTLTINHSLGVTPSKFYMFAISECNYYNSSFSSRGVVVITDDIIITYDGYTSYSGSIYGLCYNNSNASTPVISKTNTSISITLPNVLSSSGGQACFYGKTTYLWIIKK